MIGTRLSDRYQIVSELGRGGMGVVYLARDPLLDRDVAVKMIPPGFLDDAATERFRREARVVARLDHPGIIGIHDFGAHESSLFYVMPLVRGHNLRDAMNERKLTLGDIMTIGLQVAEALDYSHAAGIVHRDIKPENVMITRDGESGIRARITDFGLAIADRDHRLTGSGVLVGTLAYLAPEQVMQGAIDSRTDVWALGMVLYELITGHPAFGGDTPSMLYLIAHDRPRTPRALGIDIPPELDDLLMRCLDKEPARRPDRARDVAAALERCRRKLPDGDAFSSVHHTTARKPVRPSSPMVGRSREFALLQAQLNEATTHCRFVLISGAAGSGKTRLVEELERLANARNTTVLRGTVASVDEALPYAGLCRVIEEFLRSRGSAPALFDDLASDLVGTFPLLSEIAELKAMATTPKAINDRHAIFDLLARAWIRIAANRPLVIVVEELHFAAVSIDALEYIVQRLASTGVLVVGVYRSEEIARGHPLARLMADHRVPFTRIDLAPLTRDEHRQLVEMQLESNRIDAAVIERTYDATEGNARFATELIRSLIESGDLVLGSSGMWRLAIDTTISTDLLPATIHQAVARRLERIPDRQRTLLATASVIGRTFNLRDVERLLDDTESIDDDIEVLIGGGFLTEERRGRGERLAFTSGVVRDVIYAEVSRRRRRALHRRHAEEVERRNASNPERVYPELVHHYAAADLPEKTIEYGLQLARTSLASFSSGDAINAARTALEFIDEQPHRTAEARLLLSEALHMAGDTSAALAEIDAAVRLLEREGNAAAACVASTTAAEMAWQRQKSEETRRWAERGVSFARAANDTAHLLRLLSLGAAAANMRGDHELARRYIAEAAALQPKPRAEVVESRRSGTLYVPFEHPVDAIDPVLATSTWHVELMAPVFETLTHVDEEGRIAPLLAESLVREQDGRAYRFRLRDGIRFHDGRSLTTRDVRFSLQRVYARTHPAVVQLIEGAQVHIISDSEGVIELQRPHAAFPAVLTFVKLSIVPEGTEDMSGDWRHGTAGTGPFRVVRFEPERRLELEANPHYWRAGLPRVERLIITLGVSTEEIVARFTAGSFSVALGLHGENYRRVRQDPELGLRSASAATFGTYFIAFNARNGPLANKRLRQQLRAAVGVSAIVQQKLGPTAIVATSIIPPGLLGHSPGRWSMPDVTEIRGPHPKLRGALYTMTRLGHREVVREAVAAFARAGYELELHPVRDPMSRDDADIIFRLWVTDFPDGDGFISGLLNTDNGVIGHTCGSPEIDRLIGRGRSETDPALRSDIYREIDDILMRESLVLPLFHEQMSCFARPEVEGYAVRRFFPFFPFEQMSVR
ncbi:MAG TPA: ABC transporter substrate-binding protein [Thermoanaerobaculia bacterium]|nr:ABC transporter substrate-binding protein [Thermoanaerobaculia bacterium]